MFSFKEKYAFRGLFWKVNKRLGCLLEPGQRTAPNFTERHRISPNDTEFSPNNAEFHRTTPNLTKRRQISPNDAESDQTTPNLYRTTPNFTERNRISPNDAEFSPNDTEFSPNDAELYTKRQRTTLKVPVLRHRCALCGFSGRSPGCSSFNCTCSLD